METLDFTEAEIDAEIFEILDGNNHGDTKRVTNFLNEWSRLGIEKYQ